MNVHFSGQVSGREANSQLVNLALNRRSSLGIIIIIIIIMTGWSDEWSGCLTTNHEVAVSIPDTSTILKVD